MTINEILKRSNLAPLDLELLLSLVLRKRREYLFAHPEKKITVPQKARLKRLINRRLKGEPVAYIIGRKEFFGLDFLVDKNVLVPRPETEMLVEAAFQRIMNYELGISNVIDVGTGSGNIIVSIAKNIPEKIRKRIKFYAVDISEKALVVAKKNAKRHRVDKSIKFIKSDLLEYLMKKPGIEAKNLLIIANLPYVAPKIYQKNKENLLFEPKNALISRRDGLGHYFKLFGQIKEIINRCSMFHVPCYMEISPEQKKALQKIVKDIFPKAKIDFQKDLAGKWRMADINLR